MSLSGYTPITYDTKDVNRVIFLNAKPSSIANIFSNIFRDFGIGDKEWHQEVNYNLPLHTNASTRLYEGITGKTVTGRPVKEEGKDGIVVIGVTGGKKNLRKVEKGLGKKSKGKVIACDELEKEEGEEEEGEEEEGGEGSTWDRVFNAWSSQPQDMAVLQSRSDGVVLDYSEREAKKLGSFVDGANLTVDADGWTTVSYKQSGLDGGRREVEGMMDGSITADAQLESDRRERGRKRKRKLLAPKDGLKDFYRFQIKEGRDQERRSLREGMERDRERVKRMVKGRIKGGDGGGD
ncbi:hypothetical protein TrRE_jg3618 [Triparma retinervis]|uniref:Ribosomal RNA-processing protein 7 C-terminal domain-containing protein n=1 Tax=Triparma retinervis TaxID=2557542 RepID=A0A9W6ZPH9_9STRA|nr:hypothetical protein TrRE_jg3618 [Triparma retinervis]